MADLPIELILGKQFTNPAMQQGDLMQLLALKMVGSPMYGRMSNEYLARFTPPPGGGTDGGTGTGDGSASFGNIPKWWQDWYNASGKYGGVPPVQGLL
ncbi:MAG: hypothetical protein RLZZ09_472 [Pseudomonadota bacterium]|jgi:hypothetical protein